MTKNTISQLQTNVDRLWARANLGRSTEIIETRPIGDGTPYVEMMDNLYVLVFEERGKEIERQVGLTLFEASRWYVFSMATRYALNAELRDRQIPVGAPLTPHGITDDGYSRWNWMALAIKIMDSISSDLGDWALAHYRSVLLNYPLEDYEKRNSRWPLLT